ncbi:SAC3 domain-containing protein 1 [Python bivittatus]|uniref:SAC3 domain-containing protein 1 n=1 Tax=Python bivittatus TaxID=176946 RepID=A0A9F2WM82_PYTBI|nr:SAC3 domain-containing protein 1 [Python bivittatus]
MSGHTRHCRFYWMPLAVCLGHECFPRRIVVASAELCQDICSSTAATPCAPLAARPGEAQPWNGSPRAWSWQRAAAPAGSPEVLWQILQLADEVRASPDLKAALAINWAFLEGNFARFFRLARELPYLPSCALHPHLARARQLALLTFSHGFSARNCRYPLARLTHLLATDSPEEAAELCRAHGLTITEDSVVFQKSAFKSAAPLENKVSRLLVDEKWKGTLLELSESVCS